VDESTGTRKKLRAAGGAGVRSPGSITKLRLAHGGWLECTVSMRPGKWSYAGPDGNLIEVASYPSD
jgi:hypothetical protein